MGPAGPARSSALRGPRRRAAEQRPPPRLPSACGRSPLSPASPSRPMARPMARPPDGPPAAPWGRGGSQRPPVARRPWARLPSRRLETAARVRGRLAGWRAGGLAGGRASAASPRRLDERRPGQQGGSADGRRVRWSGLSGVGLWDSRGDAYRATPISSLVPPEESARLTVGGRKIIRGEGAWAPRQGSPTRTSVGAQVCSGIALRPNPEAWRRRRPGTQPCRLPGCLRRKGVHTECYRVRLPVPARC